MTVALWSGFAAEADARQFVRHEIRYIKSHDMRCELVESPDGRLMIRFVLQDFDQARDRFQQLSGSHPELLLLMRDDAKGQALQIQAGETRVRAGPAVCLEPRADCFSLVEVLYETYQ